MRRYKYKNNAGFFKFIAVILSVSVLITFCFYKMRPVIIRYAVSEAESIMYNSANEAVLQILSDSEVSYSDIVYLKRSQDDTVTSLETDITKINSLKSLISNKVSALAASREYYDLYIPLGTFFSSVYTVGFGPKLHFKMQFTATARVNFSDDFKSAGINQVLHKVMIDMDLVGSLIIMGYSKGISAKTSAVAAQTIIVGTTPDAFTQVIESETDNTAGLINDYGAVAGK